MNVEANLNNIRISPRKVLVVAKMLRGLSVENASAQLERELRRAALPLSKLLSSAVANAEHNFHMVSSNLVVSDVIIGEGRKLKRWMPRAQGRATPIWKRMSRIRISLKEVVPGMRSDMSLEKSKKTSGARVREKMVRNVTASGEGIVKKSSGARPVRSIFQRKSS